MIDQYYADKANTKLEMIKAYARGCSSRGDNFLLETITDYIEYQTKYLQSVQRFITLREKDEDWKD